MPGLKPFLERVDAALHDATTESQRDQILLRVTGFFAQNCDEYSEDEVEVFDQLLSKFVEQIETAALTKISFLLSDIFINGPALSLSKIARHDDIVVAGPILANSPFLTEPDLAAVAASKGPLYLLAISERSTLSHGLTDILIQRGDASIWRSLAKNRGAKFSDHGADALARNAKGDDFMSLCLAARGDIPREQVLMVIAQASEAVRGRLAKTTPKLAALVAEAVSEAVIEVTAEMRATIRNSSDPFAAAKKRITALYREGGLDEEQIARFAQARKFNDIVVGLALLARMDFDAVERVLTESGMQATLMLAKLAGISWQTTSLILRAQNGARVLGEAELKAEMSRYRNLNKETARRILSFKTRPPQNLTEKDVLH